MKKRRYLKDISEYVSENRLKYVLAVFSAVVGMAVGAVSVISMNEQSFESLRQYMDGFMSAYALQPVSKAQIFLDSAYNNMKIAVFLWVCSLWVGFIPFSAFFVGLKGYKIGFSGAFLIQAYNGRGVFFALITLFPQLIICVPVLVIYAVFTMKNAATLRSLREKKKSRELYRDMYLRSFLCFVAAGAALMLGSFIDAFVVPPLLKPICSFIK